MSTLNKNRLQQIHTLSSILGFKIPMDGLMTSISGEAQIDIIALDNKLVKDFNYGGSMIDFIRIRYGNEAAEILIQIT